MERKKTALTLLLTLAILINVGATGWSIRNHLNSEMVVHTLHTFFSVYSFLFALCSIKERDVGAHSAGILHLSFLLTLASFLFLVTNILPTTPSPVAVAIEDYILSLSGPVLTAVYMVAAVVAITTPLGPQLHYPPSDIYPPNIVESITNTEENNVAGVVGACASSAVFLCSLRCRCIPLVSTSVFLYHESRLARKPGAVLRHWRPSYPPNGDACKRKLHENAERHTQLSVQLLWVEANAGIWLANCRADCAA